MGEGKEAGGYYLKVVSRSLRRGTSGFLRALVLLHRVYLGRMAEDSTEKTSLLLKHLSPSPSHTPHSLLNLLWNYAMRGSHWRMRGHISPRNEKRKWYKDWELLNQSQGQAQNLPFATAWPRASFYKDVCVSQFLIIMRHFGAVFDMIKCL